MKARGSGAEAMKPHCRVDSGVRVAAAGQGEVGGEQRGGGTMSRLAAVMLLSNQAY